MKRISLVLGLLAGTLLVATPRPLAAQVSGAQATRATVRDSVKMTRSVYSWETHEAGGTQCGAGVVAIWPDILVQLGLSGGYGRYSKVSLGGTSADYVPSGYGEAKTNAAAGIVVPEGFVGHNPQLQTSLAGPASGYAECATFRAQAAAAAAGGGGLGILNGAPFRINDWYAVFTLPSGLPVALFEWKDAQPLTIAFDGSFASKQSHETDATAPGNKVPVASYRWAFGDGATGTGDTPSHTYAEEGRYLVTARSDRRRRRRRTRPPATWT